MGFDEKSLRCQFLLFETCSVLSRKLLSMRAIPFNSISFLNFHQFYASNACVTYVSNFVSQESWQRNFPENVNVGDKSMKGHVGDVGSRKCVFCFNNLH